jgi:pimeloyl-ACP methyl ester carboxylesterase
MAIGMQDPVLGPPAMRALRETLRGCPPPSEVPEAGHFVQEHGAPVARAAHTAWGDLG